MLHRRDPRLHRFSKKSKELLVDYINFHNNRRLAPEQLKFGIPVLKNETGLSGVDVGFADSTGWGSETEEMLYQRVELRTVLRGQPLVIYTPGYTVTDIVGAIFDQYGILIEPEFIDLQLVTRDFDDAAANNALTGFDAEDVPAVEPPEVIPPYLENRNYKIVFKNTHLTFFGDVDVYTRRAIQSLGLTIDSRMNLQDFYTDGNMGLPLVDVLIPKGEVYITRAKFPDLANRRGYESMLHALAKGWSIDKAWQLPLLLKELTGDAWNAGEEPGPFNLFGSKVAYNDFVSKDYTLENAGYNFVIAIELGERCNNLTGLLKIGYQYSDSQTPGNNPYNQSSTLPLFNH